MALITDPVLTDDTGVAIKNSIDLLTANINRTADNIAYDSNLTIKGKIQAIDLTSGGNIKGDLYIDDESGTTATEGTTYLSAGNDKAAGTDKNSTGILRLYGDSGKCAFLYPKSQMSANRWIALPDKAGTILTREELITGTTNCEIGTYPITYSGNSFNLTGIKIYINSTRYAIIGVVLGGSTYANKMFMYSSWDGNAYLLN